LDFYRADLAHIHDLGFGRLAEAAAAALVEELGQNGVTRGLIVDLGCGSGILSEHVARAGFDVLGIDISPDMVALAQTRVPSGSFRVESLLSTEVPPCVAIAAVGECVNYLFDGQPSFDERHCVDGEHHADAVRNVFRRAYAGLDPRGVLVLDAAGPGRLPGAGGQTRAGVHKSFAEGAGWAVLVAAEEDPLQRTLTREITTFRELEPGVYRRNHETHRLRLLSRSDVQTWLEQSGFQVRVADHYGPVPLPAGLIAYWANKPESARGRALTDR
jgi:SAM-dependent methyltransferase